MSDEPREMTPEECTKELLDHLKVIVNYWATTRGVTSVEERLNGLMFSVLVLIDGDSMMPAWRFVPDPHPEDKEFHRKEGENWWPENQEDLGGESPYPLHELWVSDYRKMLKAGES